MSLFSDLFVEFFIFHQRRFLTLIHTTLPRSVKQQRQQKPQYVKYRETEKFDT